VDRLHIAVDWRSEEHQRGADCGGTAKPGHSSPFLGRSWLGSGVWTPGLSVCSVAGGWPPEASGCSTSQMMASPVSVFMTTGCTSAGPSAVADLTTTPWGTRATSAGPGRE